MSKSGAMTRARALQAELEKRGVPTSIEIQTGRPGTPNGGWYDTRFIGSMGHHIVSRRSQGLTPGLALIKRGRSDVPGPLCNGYLGFDGRARIICMGWANHPGAGGAYTLPGGTIPRDQGRPYLFGWEIEGGLSEADWPASFRIVMGKCHAATLAWLGRDERSHIEHKTWAPTRKIDRLNYTLSGARAELKPWLKISTPPTMEDDMIGLKQGDSGEAVEALQAMLNYAGFPIGNPAVTKKYEASTAAALLKMRKSVGSSVTSPVETVDGYTLAQLHRALARKEARDNDGMVGLAKGDSGQKVVALQALLTYAGFYSGTVGGNYGSETAAAVLAARKAMGSSATDGDWLTGYAYAQLLRALARSESGKDGAAGPRGPVGPKGDKGDPSTVPGPVGPAPTKISILGQVVDVEATVEAAAEP